MTNLNKKTKNRLPELIMGGDAFFGFDNQPKMSANSIFQIMEYAYTQGIRAFDFSIQSEVIESVSRMKLLDPDISFFANISWRCGVNLAGADLIDLKDRALNTVETYLTSAEKEKLELLPPQVRSLWFGVNPSKKPFTKSDIKRISLDIASFRSRLKVVQQYAQYCLIGSDFGDWLAIFGRTDLLEKMCNEILANGIIPLAIIHWPSLTLPRIASLPFQGYCCMLNSSYYLLSYSDICRYSSKSHNPIYGFRLLRSHNQNAHSIRKAIRKAFSIPCLYGAIIGLKSREEIDVTVPIFFDELSALSNSSIRGEK